MVDFCRKDGNLLSRPLIEKPHVPLNREGLRDRLLGIRVGLGCVGHASPLGWSRMAIDNEGREPRFLALLKIPRYTDVLFQDTCVTEVSGIQEHTKPTFAV